MPKTKYAESVKTLKAQKISEELKRQEQYEELISTIRKAFVDAKCGRSKQAEAEMLGMSATTWTSKLAVPKRINVEDIINMTETLNLSCNQLGRMFGARDAK